MNPTMVLIFTIVGGALILLSLYGAIKAKRRLFLSGFCFYSILPIIGESMGYNTDKGAAHILMVVLFVVQFLLQFPNKNIYGSDNKPASSLATKIGLSIIIINAGAAWYVLCSKSGVPIRFGYYHVAFILIVLYVMARRFAANASWAK